MKTLWGIPVIESEAMAPDAPPVLVNIQGDTTKAMLGMSRIARGLARVHQAMRLWRSRERGQWIDWDRERFSFPAGPAHSGRALIPMATTHREELD